MNDIRKYLNVIKKGGEVVFEHDDDVSMGPETKVEVEFKDGDEIEVEVKASGADELKRLMDLAGLFHKDKQSGMMGGDMGVDPMAPDMGMDVDPMAPDMGMDVDPMAPDMGMDVDPMAPDMGGPDDMAVSGPMDLAGEPDMGMDGMAPDMDAEVPMELPTGGPDVPPEMPMDDPMGGPDMGDDMPEIGFDMSTEEAEADLEECEGVSGGRRFDYGHPNPSLGQEGYSIDAHNFSGGAGKPVRFVPARSGDNAMVDSVGQKGLREYIEEISIEKKDLTELDPAKAGEALQTVLPDRVDDRIKDALDVTVDDMDPNDIRDMTTSELTALASKGDAVTDLGGMKKPDEDEMERNADKLADNPEFAEGQRKRKYSFKQGVLPFQGLTGVQRISRNAMRASKKSLGR